MYDYFRDLGEFLNSEQLVDVFSTIALLDEQSVCKDWVELLSSVGVEHFLQLTKSLGGREFRIPTFYEVLLVYSALIVIQLETDIGYEAAKQKVMGGLVLNGFDELVAHIKELTDRLTPSDDT